MRAEGRAFMFVAGGCHEVKGDGRLEGIVVVLWSKYTQFYGMRDKQNVVMSLRICYCTVWTISFWWI